MKLSGEQFEQIIKQLVSDQRDSQHDKRQEPRVGVRAHGFVMPWTLDDRMSGQTRITIRDLSPGGICILASSPMPAGSRFILRMHRLQQTALLAHYEVRHSKPLTSSLYSIGAKLVNIAEAAAGADAA